MIALIEPAAMKAMERVRAGDHNPIASALQDFGTEADLRNDARRVLASPMRKLAVIDLCPFVRTLRSDVLQKGLEEVSNARTVVLLVRRHSAIDGALSRLTPSDKLVVLRYDDSGTRVDPFAVDERELSVMTSLRFLLSKETHAGVHEAHRHVRLAELLSHDAVAYGFQSHAMRTTSVNGMKYLCMPNGMLASCYIQAKKVFYRPESLGAVAVEVIKALGGTYLSSVTGDVDLVVAPSHSALMLASAVQALSAIPLAVLDRMGPIPSTKLTEWSESATLQGKRVALVVEVAATGGEIDRSLQYLAYRGAHVVKVVCAYNLGVGRPLLCDSKLLTTLCMPGPDLAYVYRSSVTSEWAN
jgi:orotate phosphoribosyltransferase-like protein